MAIDGAAVKDYRERSGATRSQFAKDVGISLGYLCDIEEGRRTLKRNPALIKKIAEVLQLPAYRVTRNGEVVA